MGGHGGLATYTLEVLCHDVAARRCRKGILQPGVDGAPDRYREVWAALARYVSSCLEQRKGLNLGSFCKIGWQVERKDLGKPFYRPFFRFTEQFCRAHMSREVAQRLSRPLTTGAELCPFEEFNFSKAAIKFSEKLTKDQVFAGLRALVQRLGEALGAGRGVDIALGDLGRLVAGSGVEPHFSFSPEIYAREGLDPPPADAAPAPAPAPAVPTFARAPSARSRGLGVRGQLVVQEPPPPGPACETPSRGSSSEKRQAEAELRTEPDHEALPVQAPALRPSSSAPSLTAEHSPRRREAMLTRSQYRREAAYRQALDRQVAELEARAAEAVVEREAWGDHLQSCLEQERDQIVSRRVRNAQNQRYLQSQMEMAEQRRKEQRREDVVTSSAHGFPVFAEPEAEEIARQDHDQKSRLRADLDAQVRLNNALRQRARQQEKELEASQLQASRQELAMLRNAEREKRSYDREALRSAWDSDIRMKNVSRAIEAHGKACPATGGGLSRASTAASDGGLGPCRPLSAGSCASTGRPGTACSRALSGSARRTPLGASRSLARPRAGAR